MVSVQNNQQPCIRCGDFASLSDFFVAGIPVCQSCIASNEDRCQRKRSNEQSAFGIPTFLVGLGTLIIALLLIKFRFNIDGLILFSPLLILSLIYLSIFETPDETQAKRAIFEQYPYFSEALSCHENHCEVTMLLIGETHFSSFGILLWSEAGLVFLTQGDWIMTFVREDIFSVELAYKIFPPHDQECIKINFKEGYTDWPVSHAFLFSNSKNRPKIYQSIIANSDEQD